MPMIDVSFDTYKQLTLRRADETVTYDDVIRDLLKLPRTGAAVAESTKKGWTYKGITFPHGTELRANYKGQLYTARIENGEWRQDGTTMNSPSEAAHAVTHTSINGWSFWEAKKPGETDWILIKWLRRFGA
jgi:hypothetical protein